MLSYYGSGLHNLFGDGIFEKSSIPVLKYERLLRITEQADMCGAYLTFMRVSQCIDEVIITACQYVENIDSSKKDFSYNYLHNFNNQGGLRANGFWIEIRKKKKSYDNASDLIGIDINDLKINKALDHIERHKHASLKLESEDVCPKDFRNVKDFEMKSNRWAYTVLDSLVRIRTLNYRPFEYRTRGGNDFYSEAVLLNTRKVIDYVKSQQIDIGNFFIQEINKTATSKSHYYNPTAEEMRIICGASNRCLARESRDHEIRDAILRRKYERQQAIAQANQPPQGKWLT